jgi:hypothetical protein
MYSIAIVAFSYTLAIELSETIAIKKLALVSTKRPLSIEFTLFTALGIRFHAVYSRHRLEFIVSFLSSSPCPSQSSIASWIACIVPLLGAFLGRY